MPSKAGQTSWSKCPPLADTQPRKRRTKCFLHDLFHIIPVVNDLGVAADNVSTQLLHALALLHDVGVATPQCKVQWVQVRLVVLYCFFR